MKKLLASATLSVVIVLAVPAITFAHVVVTPVKAGIGASALFTVSVPNEKQVAVTSVLLDIPKGVQDVQPDTIAGWSIATTQDSSGNIASITWTGNIPVGEREDLPFKAQTPASAGSLDWKAYQTYADGTVVRWDQKPTANEKDDDSGSVGPYSVTKVVNDLNSPAPATTNPTSNKDTLALLFSVAAVVLSVGGLFLQPRKR